MRDPWTLTGIPRSKLPSTSKPAFEHDPAATDGERDCSERLKSAMNYAVHDKPKCKTLGADLRSFTILPLMRRASSLVKWTPHDTAVPVDLGGASLDDQEPRWHQRNRRHQCLENKSDSEPRRPTACFVVFHAKMKDTFGCRAYSLTPGRTECQGWRSLQGDGPQSA